MNTNMKRILIILLFAIINVNAFSQEEECITVVIPDNHRYIVIQNAFKISTDSLSNEILHEYTSGVYEVAEIEDKFFMPTLFINEQGEIYEIRTIKTLSNERLERSLIEILSRNYINKPIYCFNEEKGEEEQIIRIHITIIMEKESVLFGLD